MKKVFLNCMLLLCALIVGSGSLWAETVTIWSENFSAYSADDVPSGTISLPHTGTSVKANGTLTYSCTNGNNGGSTTAIYEDNLAGGTSPELLVGKYGKGGNTGGTFTAVIPLDHIQGTITLTWYQNKQKLHVYSTTDGVSGGYDAKPDNAGEVSTTFTGITSDMTSLTLVFQVYSSNVRLDNIELTGNCVKVSTPTFDPAASSVASGTEVAINCGTEGAIIYYTTNGNDPTTSSTVYNPASKPIINANTTIKAFAVKDGLTNSEIASASYTVAVPCETPTFSPAAGEVDKGTTVAISCGTAGATIYYTINGTTPSTSSTEYTGAITINSATTIKAIAAKDGYANSAVASATYTVPDYATLPFNWDGGTSSDLADVLGVKTNGLGSDYAAGNAPYRVKMDTQGDYIQVKTNEQPVKVYVDVKMLGGANTSKIKIQECDTEDGTYTDVEELTISGEQNTVLKLGTINPFKSTTRFVKIIKSVHGSNIGVGPIKITNSEAVTIGSAGYTTYVPSNKVSFPTGVTAYIVSATSASSVTLVEKESVPAKTPIILKGAAGNYTLPVLETAPKDVTGNLLQASTGFATGDASTIFALGVGKEDPYDGVVGFYVVKNGEKIPACKAYLTYGAGGGAPSMLRLEDEEENATNVENIQAMDKAIKFIENGRILIKKNGIVYDALGRKVR
ncbi:MAG: chitobiase/beta-hexosaminidase C-terminal domain-containing protein [Paludibacteraceae bacterium]|nr:chitobiase/beta-hexosaminidase C-terminal domain-containing protein [Paludibacteraceae bacterium]